MIVSTVAEAINGLAAMQPRDEANVTILKLGTGERRSDEVKSKILAGLAEAVPGAEYTITSNTLKPQQFHITRNV